VAEVEEAQALKERQLEADEDDERTVADLLIEQVRRGRPPARMRACAAPAAAPGAAGRGRMQAAPRGGVPGQAAGPLPGRRPLSVAACRCRRSSLPT
jgi:hypothetical protein